MTWSRRTFLAGTAATALVGPRIAHAKKDLPNVLLLLPDQLRAQSLSLYGEDAIQTKVFDALLGDGVHFASAYSPDPVCAPARAGLLTGRMPHATEVWRNGDGLPEKMPTLATALKKVGYETGYIGKWHLHATKDHPGYVPPPNQGGFDWFAGYNVSHRYRQAEYFFNGSDKPVYPEPRDRFEPDYQVDLALDWISKAKKPWFLMMSFGPPHPPGTAPIEDWSRDLPKGALDRVSMDRIKLAGNIPEYLLGANRGPDGKGAQDWGVKHHLQGYFASILALEASIGRLMDNVDQGGLGKETLVVVTSDHGEMGGSHGMYQKGEPYEESVRVPLGFRWKGTLEPRRVEALASTVDVVPTVLGLIGAKGETEMAPQGEDLSGWLEKGDGPDRDSVLIQGKLGRPDNWRMLRTKRYTYVEWPNEDRVSMWDMKEDLLQQRDLSRDSGAAKLREELGQQLGQARARVDDRNVKPSRRAGPEEDD